MRLKGTLVGTPAVNAGLLGIGTLLATITVNSRTTGLASPQRNRISERLSRTAFSGE